jgi:hypothetical protein
MTTGTITISSTNASALITVFAGRDYLGCVINRGKEGHEGFDADEQSRGLYDTIREAASALMRNTGVSS